MNGPERCRHEGGVPETRQARHALEIGSPGERLFHAERAARRKQSAARRSRDHNIPPCFASLTPNEFRRHRVSDEMHTFWCIDHLTDKEE